MKIVRGPIGRSIAIVTMIGAIAVGNLATSRGSCAIKSCWVRSTWYAKFGGTTPIFGCFPTTIHIGFCAWCSADSGKIHNAPGLFDVCGCQVGGCVCPDHLACNTVPISVGGSSVAPIVWNEGTCKIRH
jgi:hypothetical protein